MYQLREYQAQAVETTWAWLCGKPSGNPCIVAPTGAGKSLIIADFVRRCVEINKRVLCLAHRKELIEQNAEKIRSLLPSVSCGIYSAGLKERDLDSQVVVAGIQSVAGKAFDFGQVDAVLIDEAHLVSANEGTQYHKFIRDLKEANPRLRVIGLTATPYRLDSGLIYGEGQLFDAISHEIAIGPLIADGYLCNLVSMPASSEADTSLLHIRGGEFVRGELESLFGNMQLVRDSCNEIIQKAWDRKSVLIFCSGVEHAAQVADVISIARDCDVGVITGDTLPIERMETLARFRSGQLRYLVNCEVLTTGFDAPNIDCVAILRATCSPGLFYQMVGRGLRLHSDKDDCLVLDFGQNIARHGAIDSAEFGAKAKAKATGAREKELEGPVKTCPSCGEGVPTGKRECYCGWLFPPPETTHDEKADESNSILETNQEPVRWLVEDQKVMQWKKRGVEGPPTLRVDYMCRPEDGTGGNLETEIISEWVCIEHSGWARSKAELWWSERSIAMCPANVADAVDLFDRGAVAQSRSITTKRDGKWYRIVSAVIEEKPDEWADANDVDVYGEEVPF